MTWRPHELVSLMSRFRSSFSSASAVGVSVEVFTIVFQRLFVQSQTANQAIGEPQGIVVFRGYFEDEPKKKSCDKTHDFDTVWAGLDSLRAEATELYVEKERVIGFEPTTFTLAT